MTGSARYRLHPDAVWVQRPDGSSRLVHLDANTSALDAPSTRLLQAILAVGVERSIADLAERFDQPAERVRSDVGAFVAELRRERLLVPAARAAPRVEIVRRRVGMALVRWWLRVADRPTPRPAARVARLLAAAHWSTSRLGWLATIGAWEARYPQPARGAGDGDPAVIDAIDREVREAAARSLLAHECKERALACLALARDHGIAADLVMGLAYLPLRAHVWVECGERIISDDPEHCRRYEPILRYAGRPGGLSR